MIGDWILELTGTIVRVEREDVDKSGRNPRWFYTYFVKPETVQGVPPGAELPPEIPLRIKDLDLARLTQEPPAAGAHVWLTARANGPKPTSFHLKSIKKAP